MINLNIFLKTHLKLCFFGIVCDMYNALVRALQCHFFAGMDIRNVELISLPSFEPENKMSYFSVFRT